jgi:hypothetical protein
MNGGKVSESMGLAGRLAGSADQTGVKLLSFERVMRPALSAAQVHVSTGGRWVGKYG